MISTEEEHAKLVAMLKAQTVTLKKQAKTLQSQMASTLNDLTQGIAELRLELQKSRSESRMAPTMPSG